MSTYSYILLSEDLFLCRAMSDKSLGLPPIKCHASEYSSAGMETQEKKLILLIDSRLPSKIISLWQGIYTSIYRCVTPVMLVFPMNAGKENSGVSCHWIDMTSTMLMFKRELEKINRDIRYELKNTSVFNNSDIRLTKRESEVFNFFMLGFTVRKIAKFYNLSEKSVYTHRRNIMQKYGFQNFNNFYRHLIK
ncbi:helix-turn-helix transcriptional regulator [Serratia odorifera]|nr:helix-turn-helix transcriptional regulator [Serratia odorifera]QPT13556.1 helix-turn-helix transcriptional regulator [Serratia rubidaea]VDZ57753.1 two component system sensor kinase SsrB [Serratia odorifera]